jgi:hypothetical protein
MDHRFPLTNSEAHPGKPIGPVVFQFPFFNRSIFRDRHEFLDRLVPFLSKLPNSHKFAIEMRNRDWLNAGVRRDRSSAADQSSPSRRTDFVLHDAQDATTLCHSEVRWRSRVRHKRPSGGEATRSGGCAASQGNLLQLLGPLVAFLWARTTQPPLTLIGPPCSSPQRIPKAEPSGARPQSQPILLSSHNHTLAGKDKHRPSQDCFRN